MRRPLLKCSSGDKNKVDPWFSNSRLAPEGVPSATSCVAAGNLFLVGVRSQEGGDKLLGFVCGTQTAATSLTHDSMAQHDEHGATLCIHSVCVDRARRRQGIAKRMLQAYILFVQQTTPQVSCHCSRLS